MGFNSSFAVDDNVTAVSSYQVSTSDGEESLAWSGIGQYTDTVNPVHMMILMGAIAKGGTPVLPYTIVGTTATKGSQLLSSDVAKTLQSMMRDNVTNGYGDSMFPGMEVCAKTGTAEVEGEEDTGWIVGFSQNKDTPYAFAVVVEEGGYGRTSAGYIASSLMAYLAA
jgi:peptidoglycan glycosyltransferase